MEFQSYQKGYAALSAYEYEAFIWPFSGTYILNGHVAPYFKCAAIQPDNSLILILSCANVSRSRIVTVSRRL